MNYIISISLLIYMAFNCYTDFKWLITKNLWHLVFLIGISIYSISDDKLSDMFIMSMIGLSFSYVMQKLPGTNFGAGDIKMLTIISAYYAVIYGVLSCQYVFFIIFYLLLDVLIGTLLIKIQSKTKKGSIIFGSYKINRNVIEMPQAIPMAIAIIFSQIL